MTSIFFFILAIFIIICIITIILYKKYIPNIVITKNELKIYHPFPYIIFMSFLVSLFQPTTSPCNFLVKKSQISLGQTYAILHQFIDYQGIRWFGLFYNMYIVEHALSLGENTHQGTAQNDIPIVFKNAIEVNQVKKVDITLPSGGKVILGADMYKVEKNILTILGTSGEFEQTGDYMIEITDLANENGSPVKYDINIVAKEYNNSFLS